ncbi:hypothetical protein [Novosphingobium sp. 9U]|uniref:hypothetical protein n=1 Tax=Novosphingobium sp. 9U TaxID=2653158 RepID=UPI001F245BEA|nr:hypothetical protein [Novosphingobium sp. 9U]
MKAIATKKLVEAVYNGVTTLLAPHLLYERHGELFLCALNVRKAWRTDQALRLGQFKLSGLVDCTLIDERFEPLTGIVVSTPRTDDALVLAI